MNALNVSVALIVVLLTIIFGIFIRFTISIYNEHKKYRHFPGPTFRGISGFFFGGLLQVKEEREKGISPLVNYAKQFGEYGKVYKIHVLNFTVFPIIDRDAIKEALIDYNFPKIPIIYKVVGYPGGERFYGKSILTELDHSRWTKRRSLFNPGFHRKSLVSFLPQFNSKTNVLIEYLRTRADGKTEVTLLDLFNRSAADIIASTIFSIEIDSINDPNHKISECLFKALDGAFKFLFDPLLQYKPHKYFEIRQIKDYMRHLRKIGRDQILARIEAIAKNEKLPNDILTTILTTHKDEEFSVEEMVDDFVLLFIAGQETTAAALAFAFRELSRNPEVLEKLQDEIDTEIGMKKNLEFDDLNKLKYTECVIKETLRLYPSASAVLRMSNKDLKIGDYVVPKGSYLRLSISGCGRCEEYFPEPNKFNPERFLMDETSQDQQSPILPYTFFPFSLGPRNCIGMNFAKIEAKMIIAKFIQNFEFKLAPDETISEMVTGTLHPIDGTKGFITLRKHIL